jgi:hypothetical protein
VSDVRFPGGNALVLRAGLRSRALHAGSYIAELALISRIRPHDPSPGDH